MRIHHAGPLCHLTMIEFSVDYTPSGTGSGGGIHFYFYFIFTNVVEDPACLIPSSLDSE
jgi:hypothetical protein